MYCFVGCLKVYKNQAARTSRVDPFVISQMADQPKAECVEKVHFSFPTETLDTCDCCKILVKATFAQHYKFATQSTASLYYNLTTCKKYTIRKKSTSTLSSSFNITWL